MRAPKASKRPLAAPVDPPELKPWVDLARLSAVAKTPPQPLPDDDDDDAARPASQLRASGRRMFERKTYRGRKP
jgi:hypothetical protein